VTLKLSHLHAVKRIFRYLKGQPKLGLWYPRDSPFNLEVYSDSDSAGANLDRKSTTKDRASLDKKSTTRGCQYLRSRFKSWQCKKQTVVANSTKEAEYVTALRKAKKSVRLMVDKLFEMELELLLLVDGKEIIITESSVRRVLRLADEDGVDCLPNSTIFENLELMSTMASAIIYLATNQKFNFSKLIFNSMIRNLDNVSGKILMYPRKPKRKNTQVPQPSGSTEHVTDEAIYKELDDRLVRVSTTASSLEARQDSGNIDKTQSKATPNEAVPQELLQVVVLARVDSSKDKQSLGEDASKQGRKIDNSDANEDITLVNDQDDVEMFNVNDLHGKEVNVAGEVNAASIATTDSAAATITTDDITLAKALETGKGIMVEELVKLKKKDQIWLDEEAALKLQAELQAEFKEEQRLARERDQKEPEANIALIKT
nr:putative ribonuclease H-like domain-containing protein [Tanacetum cinerariifolium]